MSNKKIKCLIVEDSALARGLIENHLSKFADFQLVASCEDAETALMVLEKQAVDLIFSDIEMPKINGLHFIKNLESSPLVVLTTAYSEYALEGFEIGVVDYLLKPITFERFQVAVTRASELFALRNAQNTNQIPQSVEVKSSGKQVKIMLDEILYLQSNGDYITIYTSEKRVVINERMKNILTQLPNNQFIRIHHSYIVNQAKINVAHNDKVEIGNIKLPISEKRRSEVREKLLKKNDE